MKIQVAISEVSSKFLKNTIEKDSKLFVKDFDTFSHYVNKKNNFSIELLNYFCDILKNSNSKLNTVQKVLKYIIETKYASEDRKKIFGSKEIKIKVTKIFVNPFHQKRFTTIGQTISTLRRTKTLEVKIMRDGKPKIVLSK